MIKVEVMGESYLINKKLLFGEQIDDSGKYIHLAKTFTPDNDGKHTATFINFPGEYDIQGIGINVILGKDNTLNYLIEIKKSKFAIVQTPEILENDCIENVDYRLYTDEKVESKINQLELKGKKLKLNGQDGTEIKVQSEEPSGDIEIASI